MAAGDIVQIGSTTVVVGFNGLTYGTCLMKTCSEEPIAEVKHLKAANNSTITVIISDPGKQVKLEGILLSADLTAARALKIGSTVTVNTVKYYVKSAPIVVGTEEASVTLELEARDGLTLT